MCEQYKYDGKYQVWQCLTGTFKRAGFDTKEEAESFMQQHQVVGWMQLYIIPPNQELHNDSCRPL